MEAAPPVTPDLFIHVRIIMSVVIGFGLTRLLALAGRMVQHSGETRLYWVHLVWVASLFISLMHFWWWEFSLAGISWRFETYALIVFYASLYYLLAVLLAPEDIKEYPTWEDYFLSRRQWFFGLYALVQLVDLVDSAVKGRGHLATLGTEYLVSLVLIVGFCAIAMLTPNRRFHAAFAVLNLAYQVTFILRRYDTFQ